MGKDYLLSWRKIATQLKKMVSMITKVLVLKDDVDRKQGEYFSFVTLLTRLPAVPQKEKSGF